MSYSLNSKPGAGQPDSSHPFFHALQAGPAALNNPGALVHLLNAVHADTLICTMEPSPCALELLAENNISILAPSTHPPIQPFEWATREAWAAAMLHTYNEAQAQGAPGVCLAAAETLLEDETGFLRWHVACCYRRIKAAASEIPVAAWDPRILIPVENLSVPLSELEVHWELLDGFKTVGRGAAQGDDSTSEVLIQLRGAVHPDNWTDDPRIRLHFHLPSPLAPRSIEQTPSPEGDVLVLRRTAPVQSIPTGNQPSEAPIQLTRVGPEISRIEVGLQLRSAVECSLQPAPRLARWPQGARVQVRLENRTLFPQEVELRLTLHPEHGPARSVLAETISVPPVDGVIRSVRLPHSVLGRGANYLLAGFRYSGGVGLKTCLIYRSDVSAPLVYYWNPGRSGVSFWDRFPVEGEQDFLRRVTLEGGEEQVISLADLEAVPQPAHQETLATIWNNIRLQCGMDTIELSQTGSWASEEPRVERTSLRWNGGSGDSTGNWNSQVDGTLNADGLMEVRWRWNGKNKGAENRPFLLLTIPAQWQQVQWNREALWDVYPLNHPDRPMGAGQLPIELSQVRSVVVHGPGGGLVLLADKRNLDIVFSAGQVRVAPSSRKRRRAGDSCEFALFLVKDIAEATGLSWRRPAGVLKSGTGRSTSPSTPHPAGGV